MQDPNDQESQELSRRLTFLNLLAEIWNLIYPAPKVQESQELSHHFKFLDLPPEMRNMVYRLVLVQNQPIIIDAVHGSQRPRAEQRRMQGPERVDDSETVQMLPLERKCTAADQTGYPPLLLTCRQVFNEAASIYYGENCFWLTEDAFGRGVSKVFRKVESKPVGNIRFLSLAWSPTWDSEKHNAYAHLKMSSNSLHLSGIAKDSFSIYEVTNGCAKPKFAGCLCSLGDLHKQPLRVLDVVEAYESLVIEKHDLVRASRSGCGICRKRQLLPVGIEGELRRLAPGN